MAAAVHTRRIEAAVTVRVAQTTSGDLTAGAEAQIERIDGIEVDELSITGIQPGLNDTTVEAVATLSVAWDGAGAAESSTAEPDVDVCEAAGARLADGFGVKPERVERSEAR